jgi:AcrR family transcriptional regulator
MLVWVASYNAHVKRKKVANGHKKSVGRPQGKSVDTRGHALMIAEEILATRGHAGMSMDAVAKGAGITKGSLYHHFPNGKDELILAVGHNMIDRERDGMEAAIGSATTAEGRLIALIQWKLTGSPHPERMLRDARRFLPEEHSQTIAQRFMDELFVKVRTVLEQGVINHELEAHDTVFAAWAFLSLMTEFTAMASEIHMANLPNQIARFTLKGIGLRLGNQTS